MTRKEAEDTPLRTTEVEHAGARLDRDVDLAEVGEDGLGVVSPTAQVALA
jgi:hypothetical protein